MDEYNSAYTGQQIDEAVGKVLDWGDTPLQICLLWENESLTSEFAAQNLALGLSSYSMYIFIAKESTSSYPCVSVVQKTGRGCKVVAVTSDGKRCYRNVSYSYGTLQIKDAYSYAALSSTGTVDNTLLIPTHIYGIKGVQNLT